MLVFKTSDSTGYVISVSDDSAKVMPIIDNASSLSATISTTREGIVCRGVMDSNNLKAMNIPVICYGLRTDFRMEAFDGSRRLLEVADALEELATLCSCGNIARYNARKVDGEFTLVGDKVVIDGSKNIEYVPLCGECFLQKVKKIDFKDIRRKL